MASNPKIDSVRGKYYFLSNFFPAEVVLEGLTYKNNENRCLSPTWATQRQLKYFT